MEHVIWGEVSEGISDDRSVERSDEDFERDNEDFKFAHQESLWAFFGQEFEKVDADLTERTKLIDLEIDKRIAYDSFESTRLSPKEETLKMMQDMIDQMNKKEVEKLEREAAKEKEKIENKERRARKKMRRNIVLALFGVIALAGTALYFLITWLTSDKKTSDKFTPKDAENAEKLIKEWKKLDETKFWVRIGEYVAKNNPSFEFQMQMMGYIKVFADDKNAPKFEWTPTQKLEAIDQLVKAFTNCPDKKGPKSAAIYKALVAIKPDNRQLPRSLAADITELAIARIIALGNAQKEAAA